MHKDLIYQIRGILFTVHNYLGPYRNEQIYGDAIEQGCKVKGLQYKREYILPPSFPAERPGRNRIDFLIEDTIILELKAKPSFARNDYHQCQRYFVSSGKDLCLLINFNRPFLHVRRILNPNLLT